MQVYDFDKEVKAIVLAAGKGTRMKSSTPKVLHEIFNKPLLHWVLDALGDIQPIVVAGCGFEDVKNSLSKYPNAEVVEQKEQNGTGHAVMMCLNKLKNFKGKVLILCADAPLISSKTLEDLLKYHKEHNSALTVSGAVFNNPTGYGRIIRGEGGNVIDIAEERDATIDQKTIREVNAGLYCADWEKIAPIFKKLKNNNAQGEYYLTDIVALAAKSSLKTQVYTVLDNNEIFGINSREHLAVATQIIKEKKLLELMEAGVTVVDPASTSISPETVIGKDTIIFPNTFINGKNTIGENCKIGPMAHIRGNCEIGNFVKIGNFVELKNSKIKSNTSVSHLSYIGDSELGTGVNIGAGTITANYDSITKLKNKTIIEDGVSIGSNSVLVAPVKLHKNAFVGALSVITRDVEKNSLALTRSKQVEYKNWVKNKKERK